MKKLSLAILVAAMLMLVTAPVQAYTLYFTSDHLTGGYGSVGPFGEVVMTEVGSNVNFVVKLYDQSLFVRTGAGDEMNFKFNGTDVTLDDIIVPTGLSKAYSGDADPPGPKGPDGLGDFDGDGGGSYFFGVYFTGQATGGGAGLPGPITFTVNDATIADLTVPNELNQIFVADVISGINGKTGLIDVSAVPIPAAAWLLGSGLLGLVAIRRRKK
jgi:hypothetical protein